MNLKHEKTGDNEINNHPPYKQQKIVRFFAKLTQEEGMDQATRHLIKSMDAREEWVEKQEARERAKKASRKAANTHSQQECRAHKKKREIQSGVRDSNAKVMKVMNLKSCRSLCSC